MNIERTATKPLPSHEANASFYSCVLHRSQALSTYAYTLAEAAQRSITRHEGHDLAEEDRNSSKYSHRAHLMPP